MKKIFVLALALSLLSFFASDLDAKKEKAIKGFGSVAIPPYGLSLDASYDPRLDTLVPGYKVIQVIMENSSFNIIGLDPKKDEWSIMIAGTKRPVPVINNMRSQEPKLWSELPERVRNLIGYPLVLPIGGKEIINIFVPAKYDVASFNEVRASIKSLGVRFEIQVTQ